MTPLRLSRAAYESAARFAADEMSSGGEREEEVSLPDGRTLLFRFSAERGVECVTPIEFLDD